MQKDLDCREKDEEILVGKLKLVFRYVVLVGVFARSWSFSHAVEIFYSET